MARHYDPSPTVSEQKADRTGPLARSKVKLPSAIEQPRPGSRRDAHCSAQDLSDAVTNSSETARARSAASALPALRNQAGDRGDLAEVRPGPNDPNLAPRVQLLDAVPVQRAHAGDVTECQ